ncbi:uncharacterized protein LOC110809579 [Carica papaya]|uniref:uncharacterized protein LOC110809579 n=1 Tax=Carica papaya TaxID=3649 RepID=UPI000B8C93FC|nr:uncharacterized protein LOC110809579 [Carica papaya]
MAFPSTAVLFLFFFLCLILLPLSLADSSLDPGLPSPSSSDIHDILPKYGFPKGLLPANVKSYNLSTESVFTIELEEPCYVNFEKLVFYDRKITGKLRYGSVSEVSGIQAKLAFIWVSVSAIEVDSNSDMLEFFVGFISKKFPAKEFEKIPSCRRNADPLIDLMDSM